MKNPVKIVKQEELLKRMKNEKRKNIVDKYGELLLGWSVWFRISRATNINKRVPWPLTPHLLLPIEV